VYRNHEAFSELSHRSWARALENSGIVVTMTAVSNKLFFVSDPGALCLMPVGNYGGFTY
jgi:hypothetical protein